MPTTTYTHPYALTPEARARWVALGKIVFPIPETEAERAERIREKQARSACGRKLSVVSVEKLREIWQRRQAGEKPLRIAKSLGLEHTRVYYHLQPSPAMRRAVGQEWELQKAC